MNKTRLTGWKGAALLGLLSGVANCGDTTGAINYLLVLNTYPDRVFLQVNASNTDLPSCSTINNRYVLDSSTNTGKQIYAALLAAKHAGVPITLVGSGSCSLVGNSENLTGVIQH